MKKIPSLFKRNRETHLVYNEVTEGCKWALKGEGVATIKIDGTCCKMEDGVLYKRFDRKFKKKKREKDCNFSDLSRYKEAPEGWAPCEGKPDINTGHWPGWLKVDENKPEDKFHIEGFNNYKESDKQFNGTCELVGPKIKDNPYKLSGHLLIKHGVEIIPFNNRSYFSVNEVMEAIVDEGIVFHHPDGRVCKVKRSDFGFEWPIEGASL